MNHIQVSITDITTGNPYNDPVSIKNGETFFDITCDFPNHNVFVKSHEFSKFPTSIVAAGRLFVYYNESGQCSEIEILVSSQEFKGTDLFLNEIPIHNTNLVELTEKLKSNHIKFYTSDTGVEVPSLGLSFYSHNYESDLNCCIDTICVSF